MRKDFSFNPLVPEIAVLDIDRSRYFYVDILGFNVEYSREEQGFYFLSLEGAQLMLDQADADYSWRTGEMVRPLGVGINFQFTVSSIGYILENLEKNGIKLFRECQEVWYRVGDLDNGVRQFLVQDPDGYLLRFMEHIGTRPLGSSK